MAIIPVGFAQVNLFFDGNAVPTGAQTTFGASVPLLMAGAPNLMAAAVVQAFDDANINTLIADEITFVGAGVKYGPNDVGPSSFQASTAGSGTGGNGGGAAISVLMHKLTGLGGRKGRGRMFWPGVPESQVLSGGALGATVAGTWQPILADFFDKLSTDGVEHFLLHGDATAPTAVTSISIDSRVASQRRRQRR